MFDEVRCQYPLPNPAHQGLLFQTKGLECLLDEYVITRRGRLVRTRSGCLEPRARRVSCPVHQDLRIYGSVEVAPEEREWVEYVFRFTAGKVTRVRRSRDRHRYKVKKWDPEEWRKAGPAGGRSGREPGASSPGAGAGPAAADSGGVLVLHAGEARAA